MGANMQPGLTGYCAGSAGSTGDHATPPSVALGAGQQGSEQYSMTGKFDRAIKSRLQPATKCERYSGRTVRTEYYIHLLEISVQEGAGFHVQGTRLRARRG